MKIPYLDLSIKNPELKKALLDAVDRVLTHGQLMLGPEVDIFEQYVADLAQQKFAVGMASGTDALYMALRALNIGPGDEVITSPMAWVATTNAIFLCGAKPVFVDVRMDMNIDESLIPASITSRTRLILPVHWHGKMCCMEEICEIAKLHNLDVVEDAAQAICAERNGKRAGSYGKIGCFSMNAMKVWGSYGEAGAVVTSDETLLAKLQSLRYNGTVNRENCHYPSLNARIDTLQAAMLMANAKYLSARINARRDRAKFYTEALSDIVTCPEVGLDHIFYSYAIQTNQRDELMHYMEARGISVRIRQPLLVTDQDAYKHLACATPVAERVLKQLLCLPIHDDMTLVEQQYVVECIHDFFQR